MHNRYDGQRNGVNARGFRRERKDDHVVCYVVSLPIPHPHVDFPQCERVQCAPR